MLIRSIIGLAAIVFSINTFSVENEKITDILKKIKILKQCDTTTIWPDYDIGKIDEFYFYDLDVTKTYVYKKHTETLTELTKAESPDFVFSSYALEDIESRKIVSFKLRYREGFTTQDTIQATVSLLFHEVFHFIGQDFLSNTPYIESSGYPYVASPRIYRRMMAIKLYEAITTDKSDFALEEAAFWYQKYKTEFPLDERENNRMDILEGSAEYVEVISDLKSKNNCKAPQEKIKNFIRNEWKRLNDPSFIDSVRSESYFLGLMSYLLDVHFFNSKYQTIEKSIQGEGPIGSLLENIKSRNNIVNLDISKNLNNSINKTNTRVENYLNTLNDKKQIFISINKNIHTIGSFTVDDFLGLSISKYGVNNIYENFFAEYLFNDNQISIKGIDSYSGTVNSCGDYQMLIPIAISFEQFNKSSIAFQSEKLDINLKNFEVKDNYICL